MASASTIIAASSATQAFSSIGSAFSRSQAIKAESRFAQKRFEINSKIADFQAQDAIRRGEKQSAFVKKQANQVIGAQRAALAAQGIEIDTGTALEAQEETAKIGQLDALTIRSNAFREASGYKIRSIDFDAGRKFEQTASRFRRAQTLATGGLRVAGSALQGVLDFGGGNF